MNTRNGERGFTLIEMLVVVAVLAMSLGLVLGRGPLRSPTLDARAAAGQVAQGLRMARSEAIARNRTVLFALDVNGGEYRIGEGLVQVLPRGLGLTFVGVAGVGAAGVGGAGRQAEDRLAGISFLPDGSSSGGRIGVAAGTIRLWVGVDWLTGRISVVDAT